MVDKDKLFEEWQESEELSKECIKFFSSNHEPIETSLIESMFPSYINNIGNENYLHVKYPTFKIRVIAKKEDCEIENIINKKYVGTDYLVYNQPDCYLISKDCLSPLPEILCIRKSLKDNIDLVYTLTKILSENSLRYELLPYHCFIDIKINVKDGKVYSACKDNMV